MAGRFQSNGINILYCTNNCKVQWQERILYFKVAMDTKIDTERSTEYPINSLIYTTCYCTKSEEKKKRFNSTAQTTHNN